MADKTCHYPLNAPPRNTHISCVELPNTIAQGSLQRVVSTPNLLSVDGAEFWPCGRHAMLKTGILPVIGQIPKSSYPLGSPNGLQPPPPRNILEFYPYLGKFLLIGVFLWLSLSATKKTKEVSGILPAIPQVVTCGLYDGFRKLVCLSV